jgi:hypothetical protein
MGGLALIAALMRFSHFGRLFPQGNSQIAISRLFFAHCHVFRHIGAARPGPQTRRGRVLS